MANIQQLHAALLTEFEKTPKDGDKLLQILNPLKEALHNTPLPESEATNIIYK